MLDLDANGSYASYAEASREEGWALDQVITVDATLDFDREFLPNSLTSDCSLALQPETRLALNQITAKSYVNLFYFVEDYIIADVKAMEGTPGIDPAERSAFHFFRAEEVKHQAMFRRFMRAFDRGFGVECKVLDFGDRVATLIRANVPVAVLLATLHLEIITQEHYLSAIAPAERLDPTMVSILEHHWLDERRHAQLDYLKLCELSADLGPAARAQAMNQYGGILQSLDSLLAVQASHDRRSLEAATSERFSHRDTLAIETAQYEAYRRIFVQLGLDHPAMEQAVGGALPDQLPRFREIRRAYP